MLVVTTPTQGKPAGVARLCDAMWKVRHERVQNWVQRRTSDRDLGRRTRQIKEIVRIGMSLRADMELAHILAQIVEGITSTLGFGAAVLNLAHEESDVFEIVATAGLGAAERQRLVKSPPPVARLLAVMRDEFRISHSFFISHHYKHLLDGVEGITLYTPVPPSAQRAPDAWHPEDVLFIPLISPRGDRLLGILSLDQPEDGKVPSLELIEMLELFASQAALAIDTARIFQEREQERQALESGLFELLYQLEQVRQGNMDVRVQLSSTALSPMAESLNAVVHTLGGLLTDVREASDVVSRNAADMREAAAQLAVGAQQQAQQILDVSAAVGTMAERAGEIASTASEYSVVAHDAMEISNVGREATERAAEGMSAVREMALQSVKKMKRLGESAQDIGDIVDMVAEFASQTNLLALNAAIEAARAGENGRGFSVVAHEIRNLATSSAEATKQIHSRIRGIQNETNNVVITIEHSTQKVVLQSEFVAEAGSALEEVDSVMRRITCAINDMNATATEQAEAAVNASQSIAAIAQVSTQTRDSMQQMRAAMDHLVELAHSLLRSVGVFRLGNAAQASGIALLPPGNFGEEASTMPMAALGNTSSARFPIPTAPPDVAKGSATTVLPRTSTPLHPPTGPTESRYPETSGPLPPLPTHHH
ncbi:MAG TPA: methyl-accepting chemotaxis protein [Ktedonobacterales bacterium]|nr:methyl-accepting chemotaxis protein [Ktedonobacterales bacterium]